MAVTWKNRVAVWLVVKLRAGIRAKPPDLSRVVNAQIVIT